MIWSDVQAADVEKYATTISSELLLPELLPTDAVLPAELVETDVHVHLRTTTPTSVISEGEEELEEEEEEEGEEEEGVGLMEMGEEEVMSSDSGHEKTDVNLLASEETGL